MPSNAYLSQVIWYNSTISLPLDTVSIVLSQFNNSVATSATTVYGDLTSLSGTSVPQAISIQNEIQEELQFDGALIDYNEFAAYVLGNTPNETGVNVPSEPTTYMAIARIVLWTSILGPCYQDVTTASQDSCNVCFLNDTKIFVIGGGSFGYPIGETSISLTITFYAPLPHPTDYPTNMLDRFEYYNQQIELPLSSFVDFISSRKHSNSCKSY